MGNSLVSAEKPHVLLITTITTCAINIACIVVVSSLFRSAAYNVNLANNGTNMCVNRAVLASRLGDHNFYSILDELCTAPLNGNGECCMNSSKAIESLLKALLSSGEYAKWHDLKSMDLKNFVFSKASAHKAYIRTEFAMELSDKHLLTDTFPIFMKDRNCSLSMDPYRDNHVLLEHKRDVTVTKEGFQITEAGMYYVYTSVLFKPDTGRPCSDYEYQTWGHWVKLTSPGKSQDDNMVLSTYHTCGDNTSRNKDTSYAGRVMYLEAGDKLHAEVSGYGLISYQAYSNFMGLYLIHGGNDAE